MGSKADTSTESTVSGSVPPPLDIHAVAEALGVTRRHVQRMVAERRIPFLKVGRFVRFDPAELNLWLDEQRVEPARSVGRGHAGVR